MDNKISKEIYQGLTMFFAVFFAYIAGIAWNTLFQKGIHIIAPHQFNIALLIYAIILTIIGILVLIIFSLKVGKKKYQIKNEK